MGALFQPAKRGRHAPRSGSHRPPPLPGLAIPAAQPRAHRTMHVAPEKPRSSSCPWLGTKERTDDDHFAWRLAPPSKAPI
jgi:hypothetical protein